MVIWTCHWHCVVAMSSIECIALYRWFSAYAKEPTRHQPHLIIHYSFLIDQIKALGQCLCETIERTFNISQCVCVCVIFTFRHISIMAEMVCKSLDAKTVSLHHPSFNTMDRLFNSLLYIHKRKFQWNIIWYS